MRNLLSLGLAALLSACALQPAPVYDPSPSSSVYAHEGPLRARLLNSGGRLMVQTSRPAYVAIFEIVPGRGVGLLYPAYYGEDNFLPGGLNSIWISRSRRYYDYFTAYVGRDPSPRYLYMIASDAPLKLSQFIDSPGALRRTLGPRMYASFSPYSLMDELSSMVLPYGASGEWADDVLTIFPDRSYGTETYAASEWVRVRCPDGRVIEGPIYYAYGACDSQRSRVPPRLDNPNPRPPAQPGDTSRVQEPTRRRPSEPQPGPAGTGGTRITARPPIIETIPEPGSDGRIRPIPAIPAEAGRDEPRNDAPRRLDPRVDERTRRTDPPEEERSDPRIERVEPRIERSEPRVERAEPRVERSEPRPEPRVERSEPRPEPRSEPRVETPRVETPRAEPPREEPRSEPRTESRPEPRPSEPPSR